MKLRNGLILIVLEDHRIPMVRMHFEVAGAGVDRPGEPPGLAKLLTRALTEGTLTRTKDQLSTALDELSSDFSIGVDESGGLTMDGGCLQEDAPALLELIGDIVMRPAFPSAPLAGLSAAMQVEAQARRGNLGVLIAEQLWRSVDGGAVVATREASTGMAGSHETRAALITFHRRHVTPENSALVLVGDVSSDRWFHLATTTFGAWLTSESARAPAADVSPPSTTPTSETVSIVDVADAGTTYLGIGASIVGQQHADHHPLILMNEVFGGSIEARLMHRMRWDDPYTYGAGSELRSEWPDRHMWCALSTTAPEKVGGALAIMMSEIGRMRDELVPQAELLAARRRYVAMKAREMQIPLGMLRMQVMFWRNGWPLDALETLAAKLEAIRPEDIRRVARTYLAPNRLKLVAVGRADRITDAVAAYGRVAVYDSSGQKRDATR